MLDEMTYLAKCFKTCDIFGIRKPTVARNEKNYVGFHNFKNMENFIKHKPLISSIFKKRISRRKIDVFQKSILKIIIVIKITFIDQTMFHNAGVLPKASKSM